MRERLSETTRGRWHGILPQLGISPKLLRNRHGPCPMCGGKDRFRFDDREGKGTWICNRCGSGDGAELVKRVKGVQFKEAAKMVEAVAGAVANRPIPVQNVVDMAKLNRVWNEAKPITLEDDVGQYLYKRCGIDRNFPHCLRVWKRSTMLALVTDAWGNPASLQRIRVGSDGRSTSKMLMAGKLPEGASIKLHRPNPQVLGIAEGIETALSASALFDVPDMPVWAAISAPLLKKWRPPRGTQKVIIFGDNDRNFTGQEAAYSLARALSDDLEVQVKIPTMPGQDWNDVHREIRSKS
jgi:putative DNA primase/helicase